MKYLPIAGILLFSVICAAQDAGATVTLTVEVVNMTGEGKPVAGDDVKVVLYKGENEYGVIDKTAGEDGKAVFEDLPSGNDMFAVIMSKHGEMSFSGESLRLLPSSTPYKAKVQVYEVSDDNSKITADTHHFIINTTTQFLQITEYIHFYNPTDMAISSAAKNADGKPKVIEILLPKGFFDASYIQYFQEDAIKTTEEGFYDTMAIPPGKYQAAFTYFLPIDSETIEVTKPINMRTAEFMAFSQLGPGRVKGLGDAVGEVMFRETGKAEYFKTTKHEAGDKITFKVSGFSIRKLKGITFTFLGEKRSVSYVTIILSGIFALMTTRAFVRFARTFK